MTMQDMTFIKQIAEGGSFDPVQAIRALARAAATNASAKEAPAAVMDAGGSTGSPTEPPAKKRPAKDTMAQE